MFIITIRNSALSPTLVGFIEQKLGYNARACRNQLRETISSVQYAAVIGDFNIHLPRPFTLIPFDGDPMEDMEWKDDANKPYGRGQPSPLQQTLMEQPVLIEMHIDPQMHERLTAAARRSIATLVAQQAQNFYRTHFGCPRPMHVTIDTDCPNGRSVHIDPNLRLKDQA